MPDFLPQPNSNSFELDFHFEPAMRPVSPSWEHFIDYTNDFSVGEERRKGMEEMRQGPLASWEGKNVLKASSYEESIKGCTWLSGILAQECNFKLTTNSLLNAPFLPRNLHFRTQLP